MFASDDTDGWPPYLGAHYTSLVLDLVFFNSIQLNMSLIDGTAMAVALDTTDESAIYDDR